MAEINKEKNKDNEIISDNEEEEIEPTIDKNSTAKSCNNKDDDNDSYDESISDDNDDNDDSYDDVYGDEMFLSEDSSEDEKQEYDVNSILELLASINKVRSKKCKKSSQIYLVKKFLKSNIAKKSDIYDKHSRQINNKLKFIAYNILNSKIPMDTSESDKFLLKKIVKERINKKDRKILLVENFYLNSIFERAILFMEKCQNEQ